MSKRIDYFAEALTCDERGDREDTPEWAAAWYQRGQLYAALALVDLQRRATISKVEEIRIQSGFGPSKEVREALGL